MLLARGESRKTGIDRILTMTPETTDLEHADENDESKETVLRHPNYPRWSFLEQPVLPSFRPIITIRRWSSRTIHDAHRHALLQ